MQNGNNYITMLGTGNALATRCYNTCFTLHGKEGVLLVDAGGGNGILAQLEKVGIRRVDISDLFVTHAHTDHLLGCIWMMRMALQFRYPLRVWSHKKVLGLLTDICRQILPPKEAEGIGSLVTINCLNDGEQFEAGGFAMQCFDIPARCSMLLAWQMNLTSRTLSFITQRTIHLTLAANDTQKRQRQLSAVVS